MPKLDAEIKLGLGCPFFIGAVCGRNIRNLAT
jgi:hypothetical protein